MEGSILARRDSTRITFDLLRIARKKGGVSKTYAVRRTNLNFHAFEYYLKRLQSGEFLHSETATGHPTRYSVTGEGERLYQLLSQVYKLIDR